MGRRKSRKGTKPQPRWGGGASASPPAPTNADWEDATAAFREEAEAALRSGGSCGGGDDGAAAERLAARHRGSALAHHVLGHVRASLARAGDAVPPLRRAVGLAPGCPEIAAALAAALLYARRPREALAECARALAVDDPTDPALHAVSGRGSMAATPQGRVAVARERLRGVRADAEALMGVSHAAVPPNPTTAHSRFRRVVLTEDKLWSFLMVGVDDLKAYCNKIGRGSPSVLAIAGAVEFVKATNAWAYWLCPVCDKVFLDSNSFRSHVESKYIDIRRLQQLLRPTITKGSSELLDSDTWKPIDLKESEDEITMRLNYMKDAFSYLAVGSVDKEFKSTKDRAKRRRKKWVTYLDYHVYDYERDYPSEEDLFLPLCREMPELWEYLESCVDTKEGEDSSHSISLVQDGSALYLKREKFTGINMDGSPNVNPLFSWLRPGSSLEESVASWTSIRKKCVHDGNEVLKRIAEISDLLQEQLGLEHHSQEKTDSDFSITKVDSIEVEISHMSFEVSYLKKKLVKVCTFDYGIVILPLIRDYLRAKLTNDSPGKELHDRDDNGAAENSDDRHILIHEQYVVQEIPGTDSELDHQNSRTEEYENSSFSDSSDLSSIETESTSINSGVGSVHQITVDEPQFLNVTLRALWHLRRFHVFRMIPHTLHHLIVGECCIVCLLCEIFDAWDHNEEHKLSILLDNVGTAFSDILNDRNFDYKEYKNIAYEIISIIVDILHKSQKHYRWKTVEPDGITFEPYEINPSRCFGCCVAHEVLGLCFNEKRKCNCVSKSGDENRYSAIFHTIDVGAIQKTEMKSFSNIMEAAELDVELCRCGNKTEGCLSYPPHIFTTVFRWPTEKENYVDMSEVLINIAAPLDIPKIIYGVDMKHMYTLVTAVCCVEEEHLCFARGEGNWLIYESQKVEFADCWESLLRGYRGKNLRPQILFFEEVKRK